MCIFRYSTDYGCASVWNDSDYSENTKNIMNKKKPI